MSDSYSEVSTISWLSRIKSSCMGIIIGFAMVIGSFCLLAWNEGHSLDRAKTLEEGRGIVVPTTSNKIDPQNNGKLIHVAGKVTADVPIVDEAFGVRVGALKLKRTVEMYQWKETVHTAKKKQTGGSEIEEKTYSYGKIWSENLIRSADFKKTDGHENPTSIPVNSVTFWGGDVHLDAFEITNDFFEQINNYSEYPVSSQTFDAMEKSLKQTFKLNGTEYFRGEPSDPQIGAIRVRFGVVMPEDVSVIGKQNDNFIEPYFTKKGEIKLLEIGIVSSDSMFKSAEDQNALFTWLTRLGGFLMMWIGLGIVLRPIAVMGDVIPAIGDILGAGVLVLTGAVSLALSLVTIAIVWIAFRPLLGSLLVLCAALTLFGGVYLKKKKSDITMQSIV